MLLTAERKVLEERNNLVLATIADDIAHITEKLTFNNNKAHTFILDTRSAENILSHAVYLKLDQSANGLRPTNVTIKGVTVSQGTL